MEGIDKNTFKRIFYDHWDAFKPSRPRFDNPDYNETVNKMLGSISATLSSCKPRDDPAITTLISISS